MFSVFAGLIYLAAFLLPLWLLKRHHAAWPWHVLAVAAALGVGLAPGTPLLDHVAGTFVYGFVFVFLMVWGIAGLVGFGRRKKLPVAAH